MQSSVWSLNGLHNFESNGNVKSFAVDYRLSLTLEIFECAIIFSDVTYLQCISFLYPYSNRILFLFCFLLEETDRGKV